MTRRFFGSIVVAVSVCLSAGITSPTLAQDKIAVYVTGGQDVGLNRALATRLLEAFVNSKRYTAVERSDAFMAELDREQGKQRSGAIDDEQISRLGKQSGVQFVCVADITHALGSYQVSARIIDVESANVVAIGVADSPLKTMEDLVTVSRDIVATMLRDDVTTPPEPNQETVSQEPPPTTAAMSSPTSSPTARLTTDASIAILTVPELVDIYIDGRLIGKSNSGQLLVPPGTHQVRFVRKGFEQTETMTFEPGMNHPKHVHLRNLRRSAYRSPNVVEGAAKLATLSYKYYLEISVPLFAAPYSGAAGEWIALEGVYIAENRTSLGLEFGGGLFNDMELLGANTGDRGWIGGGVNLGRITPEGRFAYGLSAGVWSGYVGIPSGYSNSASYTYIGFGGPFLKVRWGRWVWLTYRSILGYGGKEAESWYGDDEKGFSHAWQVKLGLRFGIK